MQDIYITDEKLNSKACTEAVTYPGAGGLVVFVGTVRDQTKGKAVKYLEFEAYEQIALQHPALSRVWGEMTDGLKIFLSELEMGAA